MFFSPQNSPLKKRIVIDKEEPAWSLEKTKDTESESNERGRPVKPSVFCLKKDNKLARTEGKTVKARIAG